MLCDLRCVRARLKLRWKKLLPYNSLKLVSRQLKLHNILYTEDSYDEGAYLNKASNIVRSEILNPLCSFEGTLTKITKFKNFCSKDTIVFVKYDNKWIPVDFTKPT